MALHKVKGNLIDLALDGQFHCIVHGCNCFHTFGSGIAREIRLRLPFAYQADLETKYADRNKVGTYSTGLSLRFNVVNAYTQYSTSRGGEDVFEYEGFEKILDMLADDYKGCCIGLPMLGMGLAGGDKSRIVPVIERFAEKIEATGGSVTLVIFD